MRVLYNDELTRMVEVQVPYIRSMLDSVITYRSEFRTSPVLDMHLRVIKNTFDSCISLDLGMELVDNGFLNWNIDRALLRNIEHILKSH
jgi:hypothetical protein